MASTFSDQEHFLQRNAEELHKQELDTALSLHNAVRENAERLLKVRRLGQQVEEMTKRRVEEEERLEQIKAAEAIRIQKAQNEAKKLAQATSEFSASSSSNGQPSRPTQAKPRESPQTIPVKPTAPKSATSHPMAAPPAQSASPKPFAAKPGQFGAPSGSSTPPTVQTTTPFASKQGQNTAPNPFAANSGHSSTPSAPKQDEPTGSTDSPSFTPKAIHIPPKSKVNTEIPAQTPSAQKLPNTSQLTVSPSDTFHQASKADKLRALEVQKLLEIHKLGKKIREYVVQQDKALVNKAGEMRRKITRSVGQFIPATPGQANPNIIPRNTIVAVLDEALNKVTSPLIDPSPFFLTIPKPTEKAPQQLPSLFIYLLVIFAKAVAAQCVSELATKPTVADPIGILVMTVFTNSNFYWRESSFINILIAKFRVACPALFGIRGSEATEEGRERLGWRKDVADNWYSEEEHFNRMAGLATGYAAISLRKIGENRVNPYPPHHYWTAIALIVTTPDAQITQTQRVVLRGLVANHWSTFVSFWGSMAVEALRLVVMDYPHRGTFDPTAGALYGMKDEIHNQLILDDEKKRREVVGARS